MGMEDGEWMMMDYIEDGMKCSEIIKFLNRRDTRRQEKEKERRKLVGKGNPIRGWKEC